MKLSKKQKRQIRKLRKQFESARMHIVTKKKKVKKAQKTRDQEFLDSIVNLGLKLNKRDWHRYRAREIGHRYHIPEDVP